MAKTEFLVVRLEPKDQKRVKKAAKADHLETSTWARRAILKAVDAFEASSGGGKGSKQRER